MTVSLDQSQVPRRGREVSLTVRSVEGIGRTSALRAAVNRNALSTVDDSDGVGASESDVLH